MVTEQALDINACEGGHRNKLVTPKEKRAAARWVVARFGLEHVAVQESLSGGPRAAHRMRETAETKWRYGCFGIYVWLLREGWRVNHRKVERIDSEEGLSLRRRVRRRATTVPPRHVAAAQRVRGIFMRGLCP